MTWLQENWLGGRDEQCIKLSTMSCRLAKLYLLCFPLLCFFMLSSFFSLLCSCLLSLCSVSLTQLPVLPSCLCPRARYTLHRAAHYAKLQLLGGSATILHGPVEIRCVFTSMSWCWEGRGGETDRWI